MACDSDLSVTEAISGSKSVKLARLQPSSPASSIEGGSKVSEYGRASDSGPRESREHAAIMKNRASTAIDGEFSLASKFPIASSLSHPFRCVVCWPSPAPCPPEVEGMNYNQNSKHRCSPRPSRGTISHQHSRIHVYIMYDVLLSVNTPPSGLAHPGG